MQILDLLVMYSDAEVAFQTFNFIQIRPWPYRVTGFLGILAINWSLAL